MPHTATAAATASASTTPWWLAAAAALVASLLTIYGGYLSRRADARHRLAEDKAEYMRTLVRSAKRLRKLKDETSESRDLVVSWKERLSDKGSLTKTELDAIADEMAVRDERITTAEKMVAGEGELLDEMLFMAMMYVSPPTLKSMTYYRLYGTDESNNLMHVYMVSEIKATRGGGVRWLFWRYAGWRVQYRRNAKRFAAQPSKAKLADGPAPPFEKYVKHRVTF